MPHVTSRHDERVFLGLGSNLGDRVSNIETAVKYVDDHPSVNVLRVTDFMETSPWGVTNQPAFINVIAVLTTSLSPLSLLGCLKEGELRMGRSQNGKRWGPRVIDMDILLFGDRTIKGETLEIPHPRVTSRDFILKQLMELDSELEEPGTREKYFSYFLKFCN